MIAKLNLGAGKVNVDVPFNDIVNVHVDRSYQDETSLTIPATEMAFITAMSRITGPSTDCHHYSEPPANLFCNCDIFEFVDTFKYKFDMVIAERIFEHMEYVGGEIGRLLEALNILTKSNATLTLVVPNAINLANMLIDYEKAGEDFTHTAAQNRKLIINSEFCNCRSDPHLSVWTPCLAKEYIESEGTWSVDHLSERYFMAGRNIYMKIVCRKTRRDELS